MSEDQSEKRPIIIKKVRKLHGQYQDAGWRPAPAHHLAAAIPFLLLLWLLAMASPQARQAVVDYFHHQSQVPAPGDSPRE